MSILWNPNKGESEAAYMVRLFDEHPKLTIRELLRIRNAPVMNPVLKEAPPKPQPPQDNTRELQLEREIAALRLDNNRLQQRLLMFQRMIKEYHDERLRLA